MNSIVARKTMKQANQAVLNTVLNGCAAVTSFKVNPTTEFTYAVFKLFVDILIYL